MEETQSVPDSSDISGKICMKYSLSMKNCLSCTCTLYFVNLLFYLFLCAYAEFCWVHLLYFLLFQSQLFLKHVYIYVHCNWHVHVHVYKTSSVSQHAGPASAVHEVTTTHLPGPTGTILSRSGFHARGQRITVCISIRVYCDLL